MFSTIEEAIEYADEVIDLADFHENEEDRKPEDNNVGLFIQKISKVESADGKEAITKLKVVVPDIVDLRDVKRWTGVIVCGGRGFLIFKPRLPYFYVFDHCEVLALEAVQCQETTKKT